MGGRDLENNTMEIMRRDTLEKETRSCEGIEEYVKDLLEDIQANVYKKALDYRNSRITSVDSYEEFKEKIEEGGFILAIGTGLPKPKRKSRKRPKQPSVVFLSIHLFRVTRNRASVWLPASFCLPRDFRTFLLIIPPRITRINTDDFRSSDNQKLLSVSIA